ncbi:hypothetical protein P885DRAFT_40403 [Corynascus similis CBS 632.67]
MAIPSSTTAVDAAAATPPPPPPALEPVAPAVTASPAPTASISGKEAATATATATAAVEDLDHDPWPQIEHNYFTSMRLHREREDTALTEAYRARTDPLRQQLVDNYSAQAELLRQLQALRAQYDAAKAELGTLEDEWRTVEDEKRREREREDEERRAWFRRYRRGGLAYRGVGPGTGAAAANGSSGGDADGTSGKQEVEKVGEERKARDNRTEENAEVEVQVPNGRQPQPKENGGSKGMESNQAEGAGRPRGREKDVVGQVDGDGMEEASQPTVLARRVEVLSLVQGLNNRRRQQQPTDVEREDPDVRSPVNGQTRRFQPEDEKLDAQMADRKQGDGSPKEQPASAEKTSAASAPLVSFGQSEEGSRTVGENVPATDSPAGHQETEAPIAEKDAMKSIPLIEGDKMNGVETIGGRNPPQDIALSTAEAEKVRQYQGNSELTKDTQQRHGDDTQSAPRVGNNRTVEITAGEGDVEMADAHTRSDDDTNRALENNSFRDPLAAQTAPVSPSSSSYLSSRNTTPELDTPVFLGMEPNPTETPKQTAVGSIEISDVSGELIGRLQADSYGNTVMARILQLPIRRAVQVRANRKFTANDLDAVDGPEPGDSRPPSRFLSFFLQATGRQQARPCLDCAANHGPFVGCVMVDDPELFPRCGNCEWNRRRCHGGSAESPSGSRHSLSTKLPTKSPIKRRASNGSFTAANAAQDGREERGESRPSTSNTDGRGDRDSATKKGPRKSLPGSRKVPAPSTPSAGSFQAEADLLPEITKDVLALRHDGVVFTDPPMMRGVPLAKISPEHPYWEPDWKPIEEIVEPVRLKHQEKYDQLERSGSTHRDKHLANRDAKRGRTILKFLEEGELHPYQLVGKQWINYRITNYDTLYRLAQLLTDELPKMNLDVTPSEWLRHRLHELYLEKGDKFDVAGWIGRAYHDRKIEQLREKNGFPRVGRPPAHATKNAEPGSSNKKATGPRSLKRKDPHQTPESTPSKPKGASASKTSPATSAAEPSFSSAAGGLASATGQPKPKKIKIITSQPQLQPSSKPSSTKAPKIILNSPYLSSTASEKAPAARDDEDEVGEDGDEEEEENDYHASALEYDGYTSSDSISGDSLHPNDWRLHQVKTRTFATNPQVTQYWHWVAEKKEDKVIEHQVLESVGPPVKWSIFKKPYNFHLKLPDIQEVSFARGSNRVVVTHRKGRDGRDLGSRGDVMAEFKRDRTKRRFLTFLRLEKGVRVVEVSREAIEMKWKSLSPETLPGPDSD